MNISLFDTLELRTFTDDDEKKAHKVKSRLMREYVQYMFARSQEIFRYTGLPDTIPERNLELLLQFNGVIAFTEVDGNYYVFSGGYGGEHNVYYEPVNFTVANPALRYEKVLVIGQDCEIIRNDGMITGLLPMFTRYASLLTENAITLRLTDINLRSIFLLSAPDDRTHASAIKYLKDIAIGKQGVIASEEFLSGIKVNPTTASGGVNDRLTDLIEYEQYLKAAWYNEIGLDSNYNMKRERLSNAEVEQNSDALIPFVANMLHEREDACDRINRHYGLNISVELNSVWRTNFEEAETLPENFNYDSVEKVYNMLIKGGNSDVTNEDK